MRDVYVIGVGHTRFGPQPQAALRDLAASAARAALDDAGVDRVQSLWVGSAASGLLTGQLHLGPLLATHLALGPIPASSVESGGASGAVALRSAWLDVASGQADVAMAVGVEKLSDTDVVGVKHALAASLDRDYEADFGATLPGLLGLVAQAHAAQHGSTRAQLSAVAIKNTTNAVHNPGALQRHKLSAKQIESSPLLAAPLREMDFTRVTDGAAAVVLAARGEAHADVAGPYVRIAGVGAASDTLALHQREDLLAQQATRAAAARAFDAAGCGPTDIDLAEVFDGCTLCEILASEALGLVEPGDGGPAVARGDTAFEGKLPINPSGGLIGRGHPLGATGVAQIALLADQLRGRAGAMQVKNARRALAHCLGGSGASAVVTILEAGDG